MSYSILSSQAGPDDCAVYRLPPELPCPISPSQGDPLGELYPPAQRFHMAPEVAGIRVPDVIDNALGYWMIGGRLKTLLQEHSSARIEFLRFTLINHKGRVAGDDLWIANVLGRVDCVDRRNTLGAPHPVLAGQLQRIDRLVLDPARIPPGLDLFRIDVRPRVLIVRDDLRAVLERARIDGLAFLELDTPVRLA